MPQFQPDQVTFGDIPGYGAFDIGHGREHIQFVQVLAQQTPTVNMPDFDFLSFLGAGQARKSIMETHASAHALLCQITGITGVDLSEFNLDDQGDFYNWLGYHSSEHAQIRQILGIT